MTLKQANGGDVGFGTLVTIVETIARKIEPWITRDDVEAMTLSNLAAAFALDTKMRRVNALLGGTADDMAKLEKAALQLGKSTSFSAS
ncbi:hypothetical protein [Geminicoccus flavidas]|uniref:hypothetical protein n=1 Tax=Geminicoccus flavidas TaxID=2506407 RepID=UPI001356B320|nr:hypothetical protein [Geminicoccus flavidas]